MKAGIFSRLGEERIDRMNQGKNFKLKDYFQGVRCRWRWRGGVYKEKRQRLPCRAGEFKDEDKEAYEDDDDDDDEEEHEEERECTL